MIKDEIKPDKDLSCDYISQTYKSIGIKLKGIRLLKGLTQDKLGDLIGVNKSRICDIEKGVNLTIDSLVRICKALDTKCSLVLGEMRIELN